MRVPPLAVGAGAGLLLALLLAPATGSALGDLAAARAERARMERIATGPAQAFAPLVAPGLVARDSRALVTRVRELARSGGLLVEQVEALPPGRSMLARTRLRLSGPEKAVLALADTLERDAPLVRFASWRLEPVAGGVRLTAEAVTVRR